MISKEKNIEKILNIISSMKDFPGDEDALEITVRDVVQDELAADELEYVAAAYKNAEGKVKHEN